MSIGVNVVVIIGCRGAGLGNAQDDKAGIQRPTGILPQDHQEGVASLKVVMSCFATVI